MDREAVEHLEHQVAIHETNQAAKVQAQVQQQLAEAETKERDRRDQELKKLQEQNIELSRRVERLNGGDRGEINEEEIVGRLTRSIPKIMLAEDV